MSVSEIAARIREESNACRVGSLRILTYHRVDEVDPSSKLNPRMISATPEVFRAQMDYLRRNWDVVSMKDIAAMYSGERRLPRKAVWVTFDDAYRDFRTVAWPVLKEMHLPVTLFVPTGFPNQPEREFWWDELYRSLFFTEQDRVVLPDGTVHRLRGPDDRMSALRSLQPHVKTLPHDEAMALVAHISGVLDAPPPDPGGAVLGWNELRELRTEGVELGAHTVNHPLLTKLPGERVVEEVRSSQERLKAEMGTVSPIFSYPNGSHDETTVRIMKDEGFLAAVSQRSGHNSLSKVNPHRLHRINITRKNSLRILRLRLAAWFAPIDEWRQRYL